MKTLNKPRISKESLAASTRNLTENAKLDLGFLFLAASAAAICAFGFKMNSPSVIVGAMVVSPLLYSVVSTSVATFNRDKFNVYHGLQTLLVGLVVAITVATILNLLFLTDHRSEVVDRLSSSSVDYFFVAFFSGLAGTFAFYWPGIIEAVAGIMISVALIPPVVLVGIGVANADLSLVTHSSIIVLLNILGIFIGSIIMYFGLVRYVKKHNH